MFIPIIEGTTREKRRSINVANLVLEIAKSEIPETETELVDVQEYLPLPGEGNDPESKDPRWVEINERADAYVIVMPEYNHGYPGSLKMLLDNDLGNYTHKPVMLIGVSSGPWGGVRGIENLLPVLRELGMVVTFSSIYFPKVQDLFDESGQLKDETYRNRIIDGFGELLWMAKALKWGRENL